MGNESGTWVMYGVAPDDPECIHTVDEAIIARSSEVAYGKFFDGKASRRQKKIMDLFAEENEDCKDLTDLHGF